MPAFSWFLYNAEIVDATKVKISKPPQAAALYAKRQTASNSLLFLAALLTWPDVPLSTERGPQAQRQQLLLQEQIIIDYSHQGCREIAAP